jgi:hypothetical protein
MIPASVQIGQTRYKVEVLDHIQRNYLGFIDYNKKTIQVAKYRFDNTEVSPKDLEHAFWHEVTHGILKDMNHKLESNESFVDAFALRTTQVMRSMRENNNG